jgi:hypothetical protein
MELEFSQHIFEKSSNIKFHKNPSSGSRVVPCGWTVCPSVWNDSTDRHDEANSRFSQLTHSDQNSNHWRDLVQHGIETLGYIGGKEFIYYLSDCQLL